MGTLMDRIVFGVINIIILLVVLILSYVIFRSFIITVIALVITRILLHYNYKQFLKREENRKRFMEHNDYICSLWESDMNEYKLKKEECEAIGDIKGARVYEKLRELATEDFLNRNGKYN